MAKRNPTIVQQLEESLCEIWEVMSAEDIQNTMTSSELSAEFNDEMTKAAISILITKDQLTVTDKFIKWLTKRDKLELMMPLVCNGLLTLETAK